ncbi:MAG: glutathione S-transferase N-terminal domain-containing protein [Sphingomonas sp.]|uniref:glutathione S-transferase family protein n=1 Tax=Sphingomonas sp. TaxID=28214 RepID=UPI001814C290|nr:glutathione S-transferase N-terminal domain-containing protein [Sphingomonas sp.]MBA3667555.1 glutathione S-transferase N-terminal domain-containing protein [Sphingomonas sp.]
MLRLFYSPGACSLVPHVALEEAGADFELVRAMIAEGAHQRPEYLAINPHGRVPALATDQGVITENIAILNFIADQFGAEGSVPRGDAFAAARCNELLGWFASSVHIAFSQIWRAHRFTDDEAAQRTVTVSGNATVRRHFEEIDGLCGDGWLVENRFSAADSYLLTFFRWSCKIGADMTRYPRWAALAGRAIERPAVARALGNEGLPHSDFAIQ